MRLLLRSWEKFSGVLNFNKDRREVCTMLADIGKYLQDKSIATLGTDLFLGFTPDQPDNCISLFEYAGFSPDLHSNVEYPVLQVRVRDENYSDAADKIRRVMKCLHGLHEQTLSGTRYLLIKAQGSPEALKRNQDDLIEMIVEFEILKETNFPDDE